MKEANILRSTSFNNSGQCQGYIRELFGNQDGVDEGITWGKK
jgi:hypothetical protein